MILETRGFEPPLPRCDRDVLPLHYVPYLAAAIVIIAAKDQSVRHIFIIDTYRRRIQLTVLSPCKKKDPVKILEPTIDNKFIEKIPFALLYKRSCILP